MMHVFWKAILVGLTVLTVTSETYGTDLSPIGLIQAIDQRFRSSSYDIDATTLLAEAMPKLGSTILRPLATLTPDDVVRAFKACSTCAPNRAVVENILKIQIIAKICNSLCITENLNDQVTRQFYSMNPDVLLKNIPEPTSATLRETEFNFLEYQLSRKAAISPLNNDLYNLKMAGAYFSEGMHKSHKSTFRLFSRGHKNRNYILAMGQDQVIDLLQNLHFTEADISTLKADPELKYLSPSFFDYLRSFKFAGNVRAVPVGTAVFADEPIMEIEGNTVEVTIIETLVIPWINKMSNFLTKASRIVQHSGGRILVEGGTRRGTDGFWSALAAIVGGFDYTSNVETSRIAGTRRAGTQAHQWIGHFGDEVVAHSIYRKYYPETTLLVDTYDILEGVKKAVRASGGKFKGIRLDSTIPGIHKDPTEAKRRTVLKVQELLRTLGYDDHRYTITYSDGLTEHSLAYLSKKGAPFQVALVGTEIAAPSDASHLNMVYKAVEVVKIPNGEVSYPIKLATGKVLQPGKTQLFRTFDDQGKIRQDILAAENEVVDPRFKPLLVEVMVNGVRTKKRPSLEEQRATVKIQMSQLTPEMLSLTASPVKFKATPSPGALLIQEAAKQRASGPKKTKVGLVFLSGDPMHDMHEQMIRRSTLLYNLDKVLIILTGDQRVHKVGKPLFTNQERLAMAKRRFPPADEKDHKVTFWTGEIEGRTQYTVDTIKDIRSHGPEFKTADLFMIVGSDVFSTLETWKDSKYLLTELNWIVVQRQKESFNLETAEFLSEFKKLNNDSVLEGTSGNRIELINLNIPSGSSTEIRKGVMQTKYVFQEIDAQKTFWEGMHGEADGSLKVQGTKEITENISILKWLSKEDPRVKSIASSDEHFENEVRFKKNNGEFHQSDDGSFPGFPRHAMARADGPTGDQRIPEVLVFDPEKRLEIPHHKPRGRGLRLVPFDLDAHAREILDPSYEIVLKKNGPGSYSIWQNPYTENVFSRINPETIFVFGVASDFCVPAFVLGARARHFEVVVISDAIAGVFPDLTNQKHQEMKKAGARFITTDQLLTEFGYQRDEILKTISNGQRSKFSAALCRSLFN